MEIRRASASQCWPAVQSPAPLGGTGGQDGRATGAAAYVGSGPRRSGRPTWSVPRPLVGGSARSRHHGSIRLGRPGCGRGGARGQESRLSQPYWPASRHIRRRVTVSRWTGCMHAYRSSHHAHHQDQSGYRRPACLAASARNYENPAHILADRITFAPSAAFHLVKTSTAIVWRMDGGITGGH